MPRTLLGPSELEILRDALREHVSALAVDIGPRVPSIPDSLVSGIDAHDRYLVSRRDVVSRRKVRARNSCRTKQRAIGIARDEIVVSTAHDSADKHSLPGS